MPENSQPVPDDPKEYNQEQYEMLMRCSERRDPAEWNHWRTEKPKILVELPGADFSWADLRGATLGGPFSWANLRGANFSWTNLSKTNLSEANLTKANFSWANLSKANLSEADLSEANLRDANLRDANLRMADLSEADLNGANLSGGVVDGTARNAGQEVYQNHRFDSLPPC